MSVDTSVVKAIAARLRQAAETGVAIPPIRDELSAGGVAAAYAVQQANTDHYLKQGRRLVGRKIGLTSKSVQKQLGVDSPDFGMLFADMALYDGEEVTLGRCCSPRSKPRSRSCSTAISPTPGRSHRGPDLGGGVRRSRGRDRREPHRELEHQAPRHHRRQRVVRAFRAGHATPQARRAGLAPVRHGRWSGAASRCPSGRARRASGTRSTRRCGWRERWSTSGNPLKAGDIIMSGALGPMVGVAPGDVLETRINGLGTVRSAFAA